MARSSISDSDLVSSISIVGTGRKSVSSCSRMSVEMGGTKKFPANFQTDIREKGFLGEFVLDSDLGTIDWDPSVLRMDEHRDLIDSLSHCLACSMLREPFRAYNKINRWKSDLHFLFSCHFCGILCPLHLPSSS